MNKVIVSMLASAKDDHSLFIISITAHRKDIHLFGEYDESMYFRRNNIVTTHPKQCGSTSRLVARCVYQHQQYSYDIGEILTVVLIFLACTTTTTIKCSVMSEAFSIERRKLMRFLGAKVILTDPAHKATGMIIKAKGK